MPRNPKQDENLKKKPFTSEQDREEAAKNGRKGGIASGVARAKRSTLQSIARTIADNPAPEKLKRTIAASGLAIDDEDMNGNAAIVAGVYRKAVHGDDRAVECWETWTADSVADEKPCKIPAELIGRAFVDEQRRITDEEIKRFDRIYQGIDFGWYPDPFAFVRLHYDVVRETLYIIDEIGNNKTSNQQNAANIREKSYNDFPIICDSAEPKSVSDLRSCGLDAREAIKGAGSVDYGMKWLQCRKIVVDPHRTPKT